MVNTIFAHNGGQSFDYRLMALHSNLIIQDAWTNLVDATLMLIRRRL